MNQRYGVKIEKPCPKQWGDLTGDDKTRFCSECQLHVHNLSAMKRGERKAFLRASQGGACVAFTTPPARRWPVFIKMRGLGVLLASLAAVVLPGCATSREVTLGVPCPPTPAESKQVKETEDGKSLMLGGIPGYDRPLWQRILWPFN